VVLQAGPHGGGVDDHRDVVSAQVVGRADTRQHQQLRRPDRPAGDDDLPGRAGFAWRSGVDVADPPRPVAFEGQLADQRVGLHGEVAAPHGRPEVGVGDRPASPRLLGHLIVTDAVLAGAVEVLVAGQPRRDGRLQPRPAQRVLIALVLDSQWASGAVIGGLAALLVLGSEEVGQHVGVSPARAAVGIAPAVVVGPVAADVDHAVDRRSRGRHRAVRLRAAGRWWTGPHSGEPRARFPRCRRRRRCSRTRAPPGSHLGAQDRDATRLPLLLPCTLLADSCSCGCQPGTTATQPIEIRRPRGSGTCIVIRAGGSTGKCSA
jgi:hypothetical protein